MVSGHRAASPSTSRTSVPLSTMNQRPRSRRRRRRLRRALERARRCGRARPRPRAPRVRLAAGRRSARRRRAPARSRRRGGRGVRERIREMTGHSVRQPLGNAADAEAGDRHAVRASLEADQPEWFGPQRRHDQQPRARRATRRRRPNRGGRTSRTSSSAARAPVPRLAARPPTRNPHPRLSAAAAARAERRGRSDGRNGDRGSFQALEPSEVHDVVSDPQPRRACLGEPVRAVAGRGCAHAAHRGARTRRRCTPTRRTPVRGAAPRRGGAVATHTPGPSSPG